ncbi:hypothetical protein G4G27_14785 [Sphingomonas sp. So64.6b]|uniref:hypothetical protein n=1 Tax=Sphingomonas sp. So64.6b TaxID=2997354 RepID=UPI001600C062|nr:hypothetical protein [Sphingomonas sp. So64.6b]QNA85118.1 hypothetical protein G4G27_14785 [Sphingomonas sp. So64.6b]
MKNFVGWAAALWAVAGLNSCFPSEQGSVSVAERRDSFLVTVNSTHINGLCYSPESILTNGYLIVDGVNAKHPVHIKKVSAKDVEGLNDISSKPRSGILGYSINVEIPKDSVMQNNFYFQVVLFDCSLSTVPSTNIKPILILSAVVNLPVQDHVTENYGRLR